LETPAVDNASGETELGPASATLNGNLSSGTVADVYIFWGKTNGVITKSDWAHTNLLADVVEGGFSSDVSGLDSETLYFYRCYASNSVDSSWASDSESFTTPPAIPVIYVDVTASGGNNGSSWNDAYTNVVEAVDAMSGESKEIWIADGTYNMSGTATVDVDNAVIYGGFIGSESILSERDAVKNPVGILDGGDSVKPVWVSATNVTIDGITIQNGHYQPDNPDREGGAIHSEGSGLMVTDCVFKNNRVPYWNYGGGAIYASRALTVDGCSFISNEVGLTGRRGDGGAIKFNSSEELTVVRSSFVDNFAYAGTSEQGRGGAVYIAGGADASVLNCTFYTNAAMNHGGAIAINENSNLTITNSIFWKNMAQGSNSVDEIEVVDGASSITIAYCSVDTGGVSSVGVTYPLPETIINSDPLFVSATAPYDLHLGSRTGYWSPSGFVRSAPGVYSPAMDAGDPGMPFDDEPVPNGFRINLGAYGGTEQASKSIPPSGMIFIVQ